MLVCKANAYGTDDTITLDVAQQVGITRLGVGDSSEALHLRQEGWEHQILVLGSLIDEEIISMVEENIDITVHSLSKLKFLDKLTQQLEKPLNIHLKVDTGMSRFGTGASEVAALAEEVKKAPYLKWVGLSTHFASPNSQSSLNKQLELFNKVIEDLSPLPHDVEIHAAGTLTFMNESKTRFDFVRNGLGIYGLKEDLPFESVLSLYSQIIFIKDVPEGSEVGYEGEYICKRPTRLAIIPIGYFDGFRFSFSDNSYVLVRGKQAPVRGRVSMDYTTVDITDIPETEVGDKVTLIGVDNNETLTVSDWSRWAQSIPHEITCLLGNRIKRVAIS